MRGDCESKEEQALLTAERQAMITAAIVGAVRDYFAHAPASQRSNGRT
ncbi:MAG TPA: hypothetical protein VLO30_07940 [Chthoniobacterales bacterium]|nr:hypothetical protein [Chthoniobacterales bacterium]